ncbi:ADP-ribosylation factor-like protein 2-binding protein-like [Planoprotostelium fungivorum]|uniref:ADP-ribosylation factor-like protein 2-binding protein n=1 Tax=Planoprotostelium fungivorum TaxID=1890364 RepID=A0A2P6NMY1_9EUKA|nr:ADP-ribosylation factor-like protein 2-binding protein-like [Planoprotostelium fungivorum]
MPSTASDKSRDVEADGRFDMVVGRLEELILSDAFSRVVDDFFTQHCKEFEESSENKLSYTAVFNQYTSLLEQHIEKHLKSILPPWFSMSWFVGEMEKRPAEEVSPDIIELLGSDFEEFKQKMLEVKNPKINKVEDFFHVQKATLN